MLSLGGGLPVLCSNDGQTDLQCGGQSLIHPASQPPSPAVKTYLTLLIDVGMIDLGSEGDFRWLERVFRGKDDVYQKCALESEKCEDQNSWRLQS